MNPWVIVAGGAAALYALVKPSEKPADPGAPVMVAVPPVQQGAAPLVVPLPSVVKYSPNVQAYAQAVALVEAVKANRAAYNIYNGEGGAIVPMLMSMKGIGQWTGKLVSNRAPILEETDLPQPPAGYKWFKVRDPIYDLGTKSERWTEWWTISMPFTGSRSVVVDLPWANVPGIKNLTTHI